MTDARIEPPIDRPGTDGSVAAEVPEAVSAPEAADEPGATDEPTSAFGDLVYDDLHSSFGAFRLYLSERLSPDAADLVAREFDAHMAALAKTRAALGLDDDVPAPSEPSQPFQPPVPERTDLARADKVFPELARRYKGAFSQAQQQMAQHYARSEPGRAWQDLRKAVKGPDRIREVVQKVAGDHYPEISKDRRWREFFGSVLRDTADTVSRATDRLAQTFEADRVTQRLLTRFATAAREFAAGRQDGAAERSAPAAAAEPAAGRAQADLASVGVKPVAGVAAPAAVPPDPARPAPTAAGPARGSGAEI
ncbi:hypothetical protein ACIRD3_37655 [Kitasatospora sp. NPDC093550]|uniref:hypothetical protein n=1 Tax=Kitasatospora sp. NPDC093550 TaxID=3364089 RepID=UPI00381959D2